MYRFLMLLLVCPFNNAYPFSAVKLALLFFYLYFLKAFFHDFNKVSNFVNFELCIYGDGRNSPGHKWNFLCLLLIMIFCKIVGIIFLKMTGMMARWQFSLHIGLLLQNFIASSVLSDIPMMYSGSY